MSECPFAFVYDERLGLARPVLYVEYEELSQEKQDEFELKCQESCSYIPERIKEIEQDYMQRYEALANTEDETEFLRLNDELNELSKRICELNLLYLQIEGTYLSANVHA
jgi:hypothetical protein